MLWHDTVWYWLPVVGDGVGESDGVDVGELIKENHIKSDYIISTIEDKVFYDVCMFWAILIRIKVKWCAREDIAVKVKVKVEVEVKA